MGFAPLVVALVIVFLTLCWTLKRMRSRKPRLRYPPSMPSVPVLGSFPFIKDHANIHKPFAEKANHLGSVFSCYIGSRYTVILNNRESIREAFLRRGSAFADRDHHFLMKKYMHLKWRGLVHHSYDAEFVRHHQFILSILKTLGMGQIAMEQRIQREVEELIQHIREVDGKSFDPLESIHFCILNVICNILFGNSTPQVDLKHLLRVIRETTDSYPAVVDLLPPLRYVPYYRKRIQASLFFMKEQKLLIEEMIRLCLENETMETSLVAAFVEKEGPEYERGNLTELVRQMIFAGSDTTTFTTLWALCLLANRQELQKRLHDELDSVFASDRLPCFSDVEQTPLMEATVLEIMRFKTVVPMALPHKTLCDTEVAGYYIPKDTTVLANLHAVHMDKDEWGDPDVFRPERFLNESGTAVVGRDRLMPFSIGKRSCTGEGVARPQNFLVISSLVQQFDIYPATGKNKVECQESTYIAVRPSAFEVRMVPRRAMNS